MIQYIISFFYDLFILLAGNQFRTQINEAMRYYNGVHDILMYVECRQ